MACTPVRKTGVLSGKDHLRLLGTYEIPHNRIFQGTTIGGLSGIDYDPKKDVYYLICDDRSSINPARFYTAKISLRNNRIDSVQLIAVNSLLQKDGTVYPDAKTDPLHAPDPEALRFNAVTGEFVWSSEGERIVKNGQVVLQDPSIIAITSQGKYNDSFALPENMHIRAGEQGPRQNGVFEGLTFADNYRTMYVSVEEPLYEDGPRAGTGDSSGWIRIIKYDVATRKPTAQYAYKIEPVAYPAVPAGAFKINGVPDILSVGKNKLLVIERSFSTGRKPCTIRVFLADVSKATDVSGVRSLQTPAWTPASKTLLLDMNSLGIYTDNIEGVTFGPLLPNGHRTLIFVADNNFSADEVTQLFVFEVEH